MRIKLTLIRISKSYRQRCLKSRDPVISAHAAIRSPLGAKEFARSILRNCIDIEFKLVPEAVKVYGDSLKKYRLSDRAISLINEEMNDITTFKQDLRFFEAVKQLKKELGIDVKKLPSDKPRI